MPAAQSSSAPQQIARKWLDLAERRLAYYHELYHSGRWRHYYASEEEFAERMLDVIKAAKTFARIAGAAPAEAVRARDLAA
jgi:uncharacterized repeat protein (TIGR03809 family)